MLTDTLHLPLKRHHASRRRRHHRSHRSSILAPITFTETVTLQEAPHYDDSSSSSTAKPMAPQFDLPFKLHLLNLLQRLTQCLAPQNRVQILQISKLHVTHLVPLMLTIPLQLPPSEEILPRDQLLQNRLNNPRLLLYQTPNTPMSIPLHQMDRILLRTSPSTRHHFEHKSVIHYSLPEKQYRNFHPLTPWRSRPEFSCPRHVILQYHRHSSMNIS